MKIPLALRWAKAPQRPAVAWWIAGSAPAEWLERLTSWNMPLDEVTLYVHATPDGLEPNGVLAALPPRPFHEIPNRDAAAHDVGVNSLYDHADRGMPYGLIGERLFVPVDAELSVPLSAAELAEILPGEDETYMWRPGVGVVAFENGDVCGVADLLAIPGENQTQWTFALCGVQLPTHRLSIEAEAPPARFLVVIGRDDIGLDPLPADELPPSPQEAAPGIGGAIGRAMASATARMSLWIASRIPAPGSRRTWINDWQDWARGKLGQIAASLHAQRHSAIARLLHMLETDPDEGLRHALPFSSDGLRGTGPPSGSLARHDVEFRLKYPGQRTGDSWDVSIDFRQQLQNRYRDLARREIALGRHRRAAYIYAELLDDWNSAAHTLRDGGHHREAAAVYRQRLGRPADAAKCLESAGLYVEAIECYEVTADFEKVGDLYRLLEREDEAGESFARAISRCRAHGDYRGASRVAEVKLHAYDEALDHLRDAWPLAAQAAECMEERFRLLGRLERHAAAAEAVDELATQWPRAMPLPDVLASVAVGYPDLAVRRHAADRTRIVVAGRLSGAGVAETERLTNVLAKLAPGDLLLQRDCRRYVEAARRQPQVPRQRPRSGGIEQIHEFQLPPGEYRAESSQGAYWLAAAVGDRRLQLVRGTWRGHVEVAPAWPLPAELQSQPVLLAAPPAHGRGIIVHVVGAPPLAGHRRFAATDALPQAWYACSSIGVEASTLAIAYDARGSLFCLRHAGGGRLELKVVDAAQRLLRTQRIDLEQVGISIQDVGDALPFTVRDGAAYLAVGARVLVVGSAVRVFAAPAPVSSLIVSRQHVRDRTIVAHAEGGTIFWGAKYDDREEHFCRGASYPLMGTTQFGLLVAIAEGRIEIYCAQNGRLVLRNEADYGGREPLAVLPTGQPAEFAVLENSGRLLVFQVPA